MNASTKQTAIQQGLLGFTLLICLGLFLLPPNGPKDDDLRMSGIVNSPASDTGMTRANLEGQRP